MMLVSVEEAKEHLRIDSAADDPWLLLWIGVVSGAVARWLKDPWRPYVWETDTAGAVLLDTAGNPIVVYDSNGDPVVDTLVKGAVLVELAQQYRFRDGSEAAAVPSHNGYGFILGAGATSLLWGLRKSTVA